MAAVLSIFVFAICFATAQGLSLPPLSGSLAVGTAVLELNDISSSRDLMVSAFYPILSGDNYTLAPAFPPKTAAYLDKYAGLPTGSLQTVISQAHLNAALLPGDFPLLIFSPGIGTPRLLYNSIAENLASEGYIAVTIDHPHESLVIEYPDGKFEINIIDTGNDTDAYETNLLLNRTLDIGFVLDQFSNSSNLAKIPGFLGSQRSKDAGVLGHSFGGSSAAAAMLNEPRFLAGVNLDGRLRGQVVESGLSEPFLFMGNPIHNSTTDPTWATFWNNTKGYKRELSVAGSVHISYSDQPYLTQKFGDPGTSIEGSRMLEIESAYLKDFFDWNLKRGNGKLLAGPSPCFPEVTFLG